LNWRLEKRFVETGAQLQLPMAILVTDLQDLRGIGEELMMP
jgi:hypothetical protein